ncbi:hypothetical protein EBR43_05065 [bacterium]|nr:hypothetical protein [bacterium]
MSSPNEFFLGRLSKTYAATYSCKLIFSLIDMKILSKQDMWLLDDFKHKIYSSKISRTLRDENAKKIHEH